nr:protease inhibitor I42 family protein [uncultured Methanoregula sp.]
MTKKQYLWIGIMIVLSLTVAFGMTEVYKTITGEQKTPVMGSEKAPDAQYRMYTEWDNGTLTTIHPDDVVAIRLPENPSTGYQWDVSGSNGITILDDSYIYPDPTGRITGQGGWRHITITPNASGKKSFSATCKRWWEPETGAEQHFSLDFEVR